MQVVYHHDADTGTWWADSPDMAGFSAGDRTLEALRRRVVDAVEFIAEEAGDWPGVNFAEIDERFADHWWRCVWTRGSEYARPMTFSGGYDTYVRTEER